MITPKPYTENGNIRIFSKDAPDLDFVWHRDKEDRIITVIDGAIGWLFQFDNKEPFSLTKNESFFVKCNDYHRLIKYDAKDDLVLCVKKL